MAEKLTPQQREAVCNRGGKLLVSAAAGSGKTKVLVDRLLSYVTDPVNPANLDDFLIITYTKAAASELRGKIASKLTERIAQEPDNKHLQKQMQRLFLAKISTVHSFCGDILREYAYKRSALSKLNTLFDSTYVTSTSVELNCAKSLDNSTDDRYVEKLLFSNEAYLSWRACGNNNWVTRSNMI